MPERDVSIHVKSSFSSEGAETVASQTEKIKDNFAALAEEATNADDALRERFARTLDDVGRRAEGFTAQMGDFSGPLYVDVARQALGSQDLDTATKALMKGYQEDEPTRLLDAVQAALLKARREKGGQEQGDGEDGGDRSEDNEPEWNQKMFRNIRGRLDSQLPTIENSLVAGRLGQAGRSLDSAENYLEQLRVMSGNTEELKALGEILSKHRETLEDQRNGGGDEPPKPPNPKDDADWKGMFKSIKDMTLARGLGGAGGLGGMIGKLSKFLGPWGMAATVGGAAVGGATLGFNWLENKGDTARDEGLAYLDLGRQMGTSRPMMYDFVTDGFATRSELSSLNYTSRDAGAFAAQYGMRNEDGSSVFGDTLAGLKLAHATGADEGSVAGIFGAGTRAGVFEPGQGETFGNILYKAVMDGTQRGLASSEVFDVMNGYLGKLSAQGLSGSPESAAAYMHLLTRIGEGGSRALKGQAGANAVDSVIQGMTATGTPGMEMVSLQALGVGTEEGMKSAEELGLTGAVAEEYEALKASGNQVLAGRMALEQGKKGNATILNMLGRGYTNAFGGRADLEYMAGAGMNLPMEQIAEMRHGDPLQPGAGSMFGFLQTPPGAMGEISDLYKTGGLAGMQDPQESEFFAQRMGYDQERLTFLNEEKERLVSVTAATGEFVDEIRGLETEMWGKVAKIAENKDNPGWYEDRVQEDRNERLEYQKQQEQEKRERATQEGVEGWKGVAEDDLTASGEFFAENPLDKFALTEHLRDVLRVKESNGNYSAYNPDARGDADPALGAYQIMASNFEGPGGWDVKHLAREIDREQFLASPTLQDQMAQGELLDMYDKLPEELPEEEKIKRLGASWYGGPRWLDKDSSEQTRNGYTYEEGGTTYPSTSSYGEDVLRLFMQGLPQGESAPATTPTGAAPQGGETVFRIQVDEMPRALSGLQAAVQEGVKNWGASRGNQYNQNNRRG